MTDRTAAIVGAGLIGRAWALLFAGAGWTVRAWDPDDGCRAELPDRLRADCDILRRHGLAPDAEAQLARISVCDTLEEALRGAVFVQENGPEVEEVKRDLFAEIDRLAAPDAILASSTSAIVSSRFTGNLKGRARCLVGHPVNPPHLLPLVEVCGADWTDPAVVTRAVEVYRDIGQTPIVVRKETDGFVLNRLQGALLAEALRLVRDGVASPEDVDRTLTDGLALRWSFIGPFETVDMNAPGGIADYFARFSGFYRRLCADPPGPEVFDAEVTQTIAAEWQGRLPPEDIPRMRDWRNERLAALRAHKAEAEEEVAKPPRSRVP